VHTDRLLGQALNNTVRSSIVAVDPLLHVVKLEGCKPNDITEIKLDGPHHLALNKRIGIMEIGMEQALEDRFGNLMNGNIRILPSVYNGLDCVGLRRYQR
jgi:hypothetical protein